MSLKTVSRRAGVRKGRTHFVSQWFTIPNLALSVQTPAHILIVNIIQHEEGVWAAAALTTPQLKAGEGSAQVFDNHAHEVLGEFRTEAIAKRMGEKYARAWLRSQRKLEKCACEPIAKKARNKHDSSRQRRRNNR